MKNHPLQYTFFFTLLFENQEKFINRKICIVKKKNSVTRFYSCYVIYCLLFSPDDAKYVTKMFRKYKNTFEVKNVDKFKIQFK